MYQTGLTIGKALDTVARDLYVLPAIQREFVWKPEQICRLFDSLMQGYPFGAFLHWKIEPDRIKDFKFFRLMQHFHERDNRHCEELTNLPAREITAILDGQQRLTSLNIGLRGSLATKTLHKRRSNSNAYPRLTLHLNLLAGKLNEEGNKAKEDEAALWFPVPEVLNVENPSKLSQWLFAQLHARGLTNDTEVFNQASETIHRLHEVINQKQSVAYYCEDSQDLDRVLRIFIRMNAGGTVLSYSDLLLSIAIAQWTDVDARREINSLVTDLNRIGAGFNFSKDFVLKAGLMLADIASVGFKVENFNRTNMEILEKVWDDVRAALTTTVQLIASFGITEQTLRADSSLLPIAYYVFKRKPADNWIDHPRHAGERRSIQSWLNRSLLKSSGIWGSGLDTMLTALREIIRNKHDVFPVEDIEREMATRGKSLSFNGEEIEDLLDVDYNDRRIFTLLSLLYDFVDVSQIQHIDHIYPKSLLSKRKLVAAGLADEPAENAIAARDKLANLQLLGGTLNTSKNSKLPGPWLEEAYPDATRRQDFIDRQDLGSVPYEPAEFLPFYEARRTRLRQRMQNLFGTANAAGEQDQDEV